MSNDRSWAHRAYRAYVGAGAHSTPPDVLALMTDIARYLAQQGYVLRSGGSPGADVAFELGCAYGPKDIFLPYPGFNGNASPLVLTPQLRDQVRRHPAWAALRARLATEHPPTRLDALPQQTQQLYARDVLQVLGRDLVSPAQYVLFWKPPDTPQTREGTRITLYVAVFARVQAEDLGDPDVAARWRQVVASR